MKRRTGRVFVIAATVSIIVALAAPAAAQRAENTGTIAGTIGRIAKFTSPSNLGNSVITERGGRIGVNTARPSTALQVNTATAQYGVTQTDGHVVVGTWVGQGSPLAAEGGWFGTQTDSPLYLFINDGPPALAIRRDPYGVGPSVGIGTPYPNGVLKIENFEAGRVGLIVSSDPNNIAALFRGNVEIRGNLQKPAGSFKIDHPLDPANKYLYHSFVESPEMMNIYNGNAVLDGDGRAAVDLPGYFGALNQDYRYQLTAIGVPAPNLHIAAKISDNRFVIAGGSAGQEVSWQVTGVRKDAYAEAHRIKVEEEKPAGEKGLYLYPALFHQPESKRIPEMQSRRQRTAASDPSVHASAMEQAAPALAPVH
jgi:hypothetical protein